MHHWTSDYFRTGYLESLPESHYLAVADRQARFFFDWTGQPRHILDVGCADGRLSLPMSRLSEKLTGLDGNRSYLKLAQEHAYQRSTKGIEFKFDDFYEMSSINENYDAAILCGSIIGYREKTDDQRMFSKIYDLLNINGCILIETDGYEWLMGSAPNRHWYAGRNGWHSLAHFKERNGIDGKIVMDHIFLQAGTGIQETATVECWLYTAHELADRLRQVGFVNMDVVGVQGRPYKPSDSRMIIRAWKEEG